MHRRGCVCRVCMGTGMCRAALVPRCPRVCGGPCGPESDAGEPETVCRSTSGEDASDGGHAPVPAHPPGRQVTSKTMSHMSHPLQSLIFPQSSLSQGSKDLQEGTREGFASPPPPVFRPPYFYAICHLPMEVLPHDCAWWLKKFLPTWLKLLPRWPKFLPRWPKFLPRWPKFLPTRLKFLPTWLKFLPRWLKFLPRWLKFLPRWLKFFQIWLKFLPRWLKFFQIWLKFLPRWLKFFQIWLKFRPRWHKFFQTWLKFRPRWPRIEAQEFVLA